MGKISGIFLLLLAVFIAGNDCAFANDDGFNIKKEDDIPVEAVIRENRANSRTVYVSAESNYTITSTNYPSNYPNNADDIWYLQTDKGRRIQLTFVSFQLESGWDILSGGDGEDASTAQLFSQSGSAIPTDKVSSGNKMWLRFTSDGSVAYQGFNIVARSVAITDYITEPSYSGCSSYQWTCYYNGQCIQDYQRCNGNSDCYNGEDEYDCYNYITQSSYYGCNSYQWTCTMGQCIPDYQRCDGIPNCDYGEDEYNCYNYITEPSYYGCSSYQWTCYYNGQYYITEPSYYGCSSYQWQCSYNDYITQSSYYGCNSYQWTCTMGQCIPDYQRCDGIPNCDYGEDEYNCYDYITEPSYYGCSSYQWQCSYNDYITQSSYYGCNSYQWTCTMGQCIPDYQRCDGIPNCDYGEDEYNCYDYITEPSYYGCSSYQWQCSYNDTFACANGDEIPMRYTCDRIIDCLYGEDEWQNCDDNEVKRDNIETYPRREELLSKAQKTDDHDQ
ncbi:low-density lipoprotein receptor-related protein 2-like [Patiria miniata]|uniref:CUB domain-containing protein n=1 Tax=Patiria miniata TaxID=46514 RepID=A0A914A7S7_PATMI|nr:low-density lipoprotein receptor-related protein 2-like [Patiria miniata]